MLDSRKGAILRAIVREYVRAGQPVGSKALTEKLGLAVSAATVRNDMALLEDLGYIRRPHSSAGGVPTDKGYRWFIDNWPGPAWPALPPGPQRAINGAFEHGFHALEEALDMTSQVLSEVTEAVAVVAAPPARENRLRRLELLARADGRIGLLLIADTGLVEQGLVDLPESRTEQELADLGNVLNAELAGAVFEELALKLASPPPAGRRAWSPRAADPLHKLRRRRKRREASEVLRSCEASRSFLVAPRRVLTSNRKTERIRRQATSLPADVLSRLA